MKKIIGIFRGFPGLGRVVSGVTLLENLKSRYGFDVKIISYLQGDLYLKNRGYDSFGEIVPLDYCSLGLLPTYTYGEKIHSLINSYEPDAVVIDGEPLLLQSLKISRPGLKVIALLNPSDVENKYNSKESMDFFNAMYSKADLVIVHGLRNVKRPHGYSNFISINTILREELVNLKREPLNEIYCLLGGGTVNVGHQFVESTLKIAKLCIDVADLLPDYVINIVCSSGNIYDTIKNNNMASNIRLHYKILDACQYYSVAKLIITRAGRNTLSELAYMGIPAITFRSGCNYRAKEQEDNLNNIHAKNIFHIDVSSRLDDFYATINKALNLGDVKTTFMPGNDIALKYIKNFIK